MIGSDPIVKKRMKVMLISVGILFGAIFLYKGFQTLMMKWFISHQSHTVSVSAMKVSYSRWQPQIHAIGSSRAFRGVNVTAELAGMVQKINFESGDFVKEGASLIQLKAGTEIAALQALEASEDLARITYERDQLQFKIGAVSKQTLDADAANLKNLKAQVAQQAAIVAKKTIKAPFSGRLGISFVNPGEYVNPGNKIVTLQTLNPILVDFYLPQQFLAELAVGQTVNVTADTYPGKVFSGKITAINSAVDAATRNIEVEATIDNPQLTITPGMSVSVTVNTGAPKYHLTLPQTAVSFNPYGELVYIIKEKNPGVKNKSKIILTAKQAFVITGETRGDQVEILKGLSEGDIVVTSGQLKLKNGSQVIINNSIVPSNEQSPIAHNEH